MIALFGKASVALCDWLFLNFVFLDMSVFIEVGSGLGFGLGNQDIRATSVY